MLCLPRHYTVGINASLSLPHHVYLIRKGEMPQRGDYVAFRWHGSGPYPVGVTFIKILAGLPGDAVTCSGRSFYVNGLWVGEAKMTSKDGTSLDAGETGVLPPGRYYVRAPHPDSLDSRYRLTGWIGQSQIIGRAYVLF